MRPQGCCLFTSVFEILSGFVFCPGRCLKVPGFSSGRVIGSPNASFPSRLTLCIYPTLYPAASASQAHISRYRCPTHARLRFDQMLPSLHIPSRPYLCIFRHPTSLSQTFPLLDYRGLGDNKLPDNYGIALPRDRVALRFIATDSPLVFHKRTHSRWRELKGPELDTTLPSRETF